MAKKGQLGALFFANPVVLAALAIVFLLILIVVFGFAWFLSLNLFTFLGAFLIIISALIFYNGVTNQATFYLFSAGMVLLLLPVISHNFDAFKLAAVLP